MWIYYYCSHGPGHQSHEYGFYRFDDEMSLKNVADIIIEWFNDYDYPILHVWKVKRPPAKHVNDEIRIAKERIASLTKYVEELKQVDGFVPDEVMVDDPTIRKNLSGCIVHDLLERMHKAGLMYSADDISNWRYSKSSPAREHRKKILAIMRRTKRYPGYNSKGEYDKERANV